MAATHDAAIKNTTPSVPYTNWVTVTTNIRDVLHPSLDGNTVFAYASLYNMAVNGPDDTHLLGSVTLGDMAMPISGYSPAVSLVPYCVLPE